MKTAPDTCPACGTKLILSDGWVPSYNDPDNASLEPMAEPFCPECEPPTMTNQTPEQLDRLNNAAWTRGLWTMVNEYTDAEPPDDKMLKWMTYNEAVWSLQKEGSEKPGMMRGMFVEPVYPDPKHPDKGMCAICYVSLDIYDKITKVWESMPHTTNHAICSNE